MYSDDVFGLLRQVITSWEVIFVVIALVLFLHIVFYVSRAYHTPSSFKLKKINFKKKSKPEKVVSDQLDSDGSSNDDLGLEEAD